MKTIGLPDWLGNQKKWHGTLFRKFRNTPYYCVSLKQGFEGPLSCQIQCYELISVICLIGLHIRGSFSYGFIAQRSTNVTMEIYKVLKEKKKPGPGDGSLICYISNIFINLSLSEILQRTASWLSIIFKLIGSLSGLQIPKKK